MGYRASGSGIEKVGGDIHTPNVLKKLYRLLGSRNASVLTFTMLILLFLVWLLPFQIYGVPAQVVRNIANNQWLFRIPYLLFFLNALLCLLQSLPTNLRRMSHPIALPDRDRMQQLPLTATLIAGAYAARGPGESVPPGGPHGDLKGIKQVLRRHGFFTLRQNETSLAACTNRYSPLGNLLLHASFFLIPLGIFISLYTAFSGYAVVTEGQTFNAGEKASYVNLEPTINGANHPALPPVSFRLDAVRPVFWEDKLLFSDLSAGVTYEEEGISRYKIIRLNSPWYYRGNFIALRGFGYAPYYVFKDKAGQVLDESFVNLKVFPSGFEDSFTVKDFAYRINVTIYSDYTVKNGKFETKTQNLANPILLVKLTDDKNKIKYEKAVLPGDPLYYNGYSLLFPEICYYGEFSIFHDPGIWVVFSGLLMACLGLIIKLGFYRREFYVMVCADSLLLAGRTEYYPRTYEKKFNQLVELIKKRMEQ
ncbi:MAG TPA: cytochrome c biogenesis protein ResB [Bacillota bacterium]|nr:cytochrome c biogenesis protein ResB [Bacillota bacterium]